MRWNYGHKAMISHHIVPQICTYKTLNWRFSSQMILGFFAKTTQHSTKKRIITVSSWGPQDRKSVFYLNDHNASSVSFDEDHSTTKLSQFEMLHSPIGCHFFRTTGPQIVLTFQNFKTKVGVISWGPQDHKTVFHAQVSSSKVGIFSWGPQDHKIVFHS